MKEKERGGDEKGERNKLKKLKCIEINKSGE